MIKSGFIYWFELLEIFYSTQPIKGGKRDDADRVNIQSLKS